MLCSLSHTIITVFSNQLNQSSPLYQKTTLYRKSLKNQLFSSVNETLSYILVNETTFIILAPHFVYLDAFYHVGL